MIPPISTLKITKLPGAMPLDHTGALLLDPAAYVVAALEGLPPVQTPHLDPALSSPTFSKITWAGQQ